MRPGLGIKRRQGLRGLWAALGGRDERGRQAVLHGRARHGLVAKVHRDRELVDVKLTVLYVGEANIYIYIGFGFACDIS